MHSTWMILDHSLPDSHKWHTFHILKCWVLLPIYVQGGPVYTHFFSMTGISMPPVFIIWLPYGSHPWGVLSLVFMSTLILFIHTLFFCNIPFIPFVIYPDNHNAWFLSSKWRDRKYCKTSFNFILLRWENCSSLAAEIFFSWWIPISNTIVEYECFWCFIRMYLVFLKLLFPCF